MYFYNKNSKFKSKKLIHLKLRKWFKEAGYSKDYFLLLINSLQSV